MDAIDLAGYSFGAKKMSSLPPTNPADAPSLEP